MGTKENVTKWLNGHQTFNAADVNPADYNHFVSVMTAAADYCIKKKIAESAKWIRENVGDAVAVDYLKAMEE